MHEKISAEESYEYLVVLASFGIVFSLIINVITFNVFHSSPIFNFYNHLPCFNGAFVF